MFNLFFILLLLLNFHSIHDYIRNKFGFYGKTALQFFNFLFVLKLIEPEIKKGYFISIKKGYFISIKKCLYSKLRKQNTGAERNCLLSEYRKIIYQDKKNEHFKNSIFMINSFSDFNAMPALTYNAK